MRNQIVRSGLFMFAFCALAIISVPVKATDVNSNSDRANRCEQKTLTAAQFLQIVREVALHDLTDVGFIEKTLRTKFEVRPTTYGEQAGHRFEYDNNSAQSVFDARVSVRLGVLDDPIMQRKYKWIAILRIDILDPCLAIDPSSLSNTFIASTDHPRTSTLLPDAAGKSCSQGLSTSNDKIHRYITWSFGPNGLRQSLGIFENPGPEGNYPPGVPPPNFGLC